MGMIVVDVIEIAVAVVRDGKETFCLKVSEMFCLSVLFVSKVLPKGLFGEESERNFLRYYLLG